MKNKKEGLVSVCRSIGSRIPLWTQGVGGNVSIKEDHFLWIKASGERLDRVSSTEGVACLNIKGFCQSINEERGFFSETDYAEALLKWQNKDYPKPSMESGFHAVFPKFLVIHFHSLASLLMSHISETRFTEWELWLKSNANGLKIKMVPYVCPGRPLMQFVQKDNSSDIYILKNHGVILQADTTEIVQLWETLEYQFCKDWGYLKLSLFLKSDSAWIDLLKESKLKISPFKTYFPDVAVFKDKLYEQLIAIERGGKTVYQLKDSCWKHFPDIAEIWCAITLLYELEPELAELSIDATYEINGLPTEAIRRENLLK